MGQWAAILAACAGAALGSPRGGILMSTAGEDDGGRESESRFVRNHASPAVQFERRPRRPDDKSLGFRYEPRRARMAGRPSFANDFPRTPEVDALVDAFARGNYARVRAEAPRLERATDDTHVKRAARILVERTGPDPLAAGLLALTAVLLLVLAGYWMAHGKPPPPEPPEAPSR
jgi:hypothetical protein